MTIRLQQMHPALVHFPVALLPLAVGADLLGCMTGNNSLLSFGQKAIGVAAAGAVASAVTGLIAGEEVNVKGASQDMLMTHRNLNFVATVVASCMAVWRAQHRRPNALYLGAGAAGIGVVTYTAYLGGKLVYDVGVGVEPAHGVYRADAPVLKTGQIDAFFRTAGTDLVHGVQHMIEELRAGNFVPTIVTWYKKRYASAPRQIASATPPPRLWSASSTEERASACAATACAMPEAHGGRPPPKRNWYSQSNRVSRGIARASNAYASVRVESTSPEAASLFSAPKFASG